MVLIPEDDVATTEGMLDAAVDKAALRPRWMCC